MAQGLVRPAGWRAPGRDLQAAAGKPGVLFFFFFFSFQLGLRLDYRRAQGRADVPDGRDPAARGGLGAFFLFFVAKFFALSFCFLLSLLFSPTSDEINSLSLSFSHFSTQEDWLDLAAGLLPTDCVASAACHEPSTTATAKAGAGGAAGGKSGAAALASLLEKNCPRDQQHLFSLYVHTPKGVDFLEGVSPASRFSKALIANRVATEWGGFTLASATRALLRAALLDPNNQRFALLSESCVPLYAPAVVYTQLIYSEKSRINACADGERVFFFIFHVFRFFSGCFRGRGSRLNKNLKKTSKKKTQNIKYIKHTGVKADWPLDGYRYSWRMKDATGGKLTGEREKERVFFFFFFNFPSFSSLPSESSHLFALSLSDPGKFLHKNTTTKSTEDSWRKSHQWVGLTRKHAAATAADAVVAEAFKRHCTNAPDPDLGGAWRSCFSDEHYFPTLLAIGGWDSETVRRFFFSFHLREVERQREREKNSLSYLSRLFHNNNNDRTARET